MGRRLFVAASAFSLLVERPAFHARFGLGAISGAWCGALFFVRYFACVILCFVAWVLLIVKGGCGCARVECW